MFYVFLLLERASFLSEVGAGADRVNWKLCACLFIYELLFTALHETAKGKIQNKH